MIDGLHYLPPARHYHRHHHPLHHHRRHWFGTKQMNDCTSNQCIDLAFLFFIIATIYGHSYHHYHRRWHHPRPPSSIAASNPRRPTSNLTRPSVQHVISSSHPSPHDYNIYLCSPTISNLQSNTPRRNCYCRHHHQLPWPSVGQCIGNGEGADDHRTVGTGPKAEGLQPWPPRRLGTCCR